MFEKRKISKALKNLTKEAGKLHEYNHELAKKKLSLYKKVLKDNLEACEESIEIIQAQEKYFIQVRRLLIDLDFQRDEELRKYENNFVGLLSQAGTMLNSIIHSLFSQRESLKAKNPANYKIYFKEELKIYKEYEVWEKKIPSQISAFHEKTKKWMSKKHKATQERMSFLIEMSVFLHVFPYIIMGEKSPNPFYIQFITECIEILLTAGISFTVATLVVWLGDMLKYLYNIRKNVT